MSLDLTLKKLEFNIKRGEFCPHRLEIAQKKKTVRMLRTVLSFLLVYKTILTRQNRHSSEPSLSAKPSA